MKKVGKLRRFNARPLLIYRSLVYLGRQPVTYRFFPIHPHLLDFTCLASAKASMGVALATQGHKVPWRPRGARAHQRWG